MTETKYIRKIGKNGYCLIDRQLYESSKTMFPRKKIKLENGLWALLMQLDDPLAEEVQEVTRGKRALEVCWYLVAKIHFRSGNVYLMFSSHNHMEQLAKDLKINLNKTLKKASFQVYLGEAYLSFSEGGKILNDSINHGVPPTINLLVYAPKKEEKQ